MKKRGLRKWIYHGLSVGAWVGGGAATVIAAVSRFDLNRHKSLPWFCTFIEWCKHESSLYGPLLLAAVGGIVFFQKQIGEPWVWRSIQAFVDDFAAYAFKEQRASDPLHHHRVTLFKRYSKWHFYCWKKKPWQPHLIPVVRSGHTTQNSSTCFLVPDDADQAQGIAGMCWTHDRVFLQPSLPAVTADSSSDVIGTYAKQTWEPEETVRRRLKKRPLPRSLCGIPIKVKGEMWGVIILDSTSENGTSDENREEYELFAKSLGKLLERV